MIVGTIRGFLFPWPVHFFALVVVVVIVVAVAVVVDVDVAGLLYTKESLYCLYPAVSQSNV